MFQNLQGSDDNISNNKTYKNYLHWGHCSTLFGKMTHQKNLEMSFKTNLKQ